CKEVWYQEPDGVVDTGLHVGDVTGDYTSGRWIVFVVKVSRSHAATPELTSLVLRTMTNPKQLPLVLIPVAIVLWSAVRLAMLLWHRRVEENALVGSKDVRETEQDSG